MAEVFGTVTAALSLVDLTTRVVKYIREVKGGLGSVGKELEPLEKQVDLLQKTSKIIQEYYPSQACSPASSRFLDNSTDLVKSLSLVSSECLGVIRDLEKQLSLINGDSDRPPAVVLERHGSPALVQRLEKLKSNSERLSRYKKAKGHLQNFEKRLDTYQKAINTIQNTIAQDFSERNSRVVSRQLQAMHEDLQSLVPGNMRECPRDAGASLAAAAQALKPPPIHIRKAVSDIFTGREAHLNLLRQSFEAPGPPAQRRVVVYGVGGSGKTEFCCKFAHDNSRSYWGIFFVDSSTDERIDQTMKTIADRAGCGETKPAVLHWLSNLEEPWLLIIDNANDNKLKLGKLFPRCDRGHILVTTRNPEFRYHGTVDPALFHFEKLDQAEAIQLLFKASGKRMPWNERLARKVTNHLGNLALAIVYAGHSIRENLVELAGYLGYYQRRLDELRSSSRRLSMDLSSDNDSNAVIRVFATLEGCYQHLEKRSADGFASATDAMDLLKLFAFFHNENISLDIIRRAMRDARMESDRGTKDVTEQRSNPLTRTSWSESIRRLPSVLIEGFMSVGHRYYLPFPQVIRAGWDDPDIASNIEYYMDRVKLAMKELTHLSLLAYNEHSETYKMHPLVHEWARERPDMRFSDQRMWSDAAARVLSASILLPPLGTDADDERHVVGLLPHIKHVQQRQKVLDYISNRGYRLYWVPWKMPTTIMGAEKIRMLAKLSVVYAKSGRFKEAEVYLAQVVGVLTDYAGEKDRRTRDAKLALSGIYFHLGQPERTAELQEQVLEVCEKHLGPMHIDTLRVMNRLGQARWLQGRYTEAQRLQRPAVKELAERLGDDHPETLDAIDNLGITVAKFWHEPDFQEAYDLHQVAVAGMRKVHGRTHNRTLLASQNLCRAAVMLGGRKRINEASQMMDEVLEIRKTHFGPEHPMTLLTLVNTAVVKGALGDRKSLTAAESLVKAALATAQRNFAEHSVHTNTRQESTKDIDETDLTEAEETTGVGPNHIGILFGLHTLASILAQLGQWEEARYIFADIEAKQKKMHARRGDCHPDRLGTLVDLARCHYELGNLDPSIKHCKEAIDGFREISEEEHPITRGLGTTLRKLEALKLEGLKCGVGEQAAGERIIFPWVLFPDISKE